MADTLMDDVSLCTQEAQRLALQLARESDDPASRDSDKNARRSRATLIDSAARVLALASNGQGRSPGTESTGEAASEDADRPIGERLWELTCSITRLSARSRAPSPL